MNIEYLRFFYEVASVKSISKVANNSHISQPALSQQIHKLEDNLGYKLLDRSNKGVQLTEAGKIVEKYAKNITMEQECIMYDLYMHKLPQKVKIGIPKNVWFFCGNP